MINQITSEVYLFGSIMLHNVIKNEFNCEYASLATIQHSIVIEFTGKTAKNIYLDLRNSRLQVVAMITEADINNNDLNTAAIINLTLYSMFREIGLESKGRNVGDTNQLNPYRSVLKWLLQFCKEV